MNALAYRLDPLPPTVAPLLTQAALVSGLTALQKSQTACDNAGSETVGSYGLMACIELLQDCRSRCERAEKMLLEFAEVELLLLRCQLNECAEICDRCRKACTRFRDFDHWSDCAAAVRECADVCRYLLLRLPTPFSAER